MALFSECMQKCARKVLDTADIVREGDFATTNPASRSPTWVCPSVHRCITQRRTSGFLDGYPVAGGYLAPLGYAAR
jgi:hypothetical protein